MRKIDPRNLVLDLLRRSSCIVQVASVIADEQERILSWGWNSMGPSGFGLCAERHAISRSNRSRLYSATIYVAGEYRRGPNMVTAKPCEKCQRLINKYNMAIVYRDKNGKWVCQ